MSDRNTRDRLLDATEQLIAQQGYANTSLREITAKAKANLAAVNYHFGSKEKLTLEMLSRRLEPLNKERIALLEAELDRAQKANCRPNAETLLRAFLEPAITFFQHQEGGKHFLRMFSRIHADPDDTIRQAFIHHMAPVFLRFLENLQNAMPEVSPDKLAPRLFFCVGAMGHGASLLVGEDFRPKDRAPDVPPIPDAKTLSEELIGFVLRGMEVK